MRRFLAVLLAGFAFSCRCVVPLHQAMSDLQEAGYRSWSADEEISLLTPWGEAATETMRERISSSVLAIEAEFQTQLPRPLYVALTSVPRDEEGGTTAVPTIHGVEAFAVASQNSVVAFVREEAELLDEDTRLRRTLQHEIAHLVAGRIGLRGKTWFREGLALEVEYATIHRGRLVLSPDPESLVMSRQIHKNVRLAEVLHWAENGGAILEGEEEAFLMGRPLSHSLLRFLLDRRGARLGESGGFLDGLLEVYRLGEGEILALESEWHEWLEGMVKGS